MLERDLPTYDASGKQHESGENKADDMRVDIDTNAGKPKVSF